MKYLKFLLLCFYAIICFTSYGQKLIKPPKIAPLQEDFVKLSGEAKLIDSQYILILTLSVSGKNEISIDKPRFFEPGEYSIAPNRLFLQKLIRRSTVNIYPGSHGDPLFDEDWGKKIKVTAQKPRIDTLNIGVFYPFEIGEYAITAQIDYWNKSIQHTATSNEVPLSVLFLPAKSPFN